MRSLEAETWNETRLACGNGSWGFMGLMAHGSWLMAIGFFLLSRPTRFPIPHQDRNVDA